MSNPSIPDLVNRISTLGSQLSESNADNEKARRSLLTAARNLCLRLETPIETLRRIVWSELPLLACLQIGNDIDLFSHLGRGTNSLSQLAETTHVDPALLSRILKHLAAVGAITETGADSYTPAPLTAAIAQEAMYRDIAQIAFQMHQVSYAQVPKHLRETGYQNPTDPTSCPFNAAFKTAKPYFVWSKDQPGLDEMLHNALEGYVSDYRRWFDEGGYPVRERLIAGFEERGGGGEEGVMLVDIGGGRGRDICAFREEFPDAPGRLVLQDMENVVAPVRDSLPEGVEGMGYDFYTTQPIRGARAYYLHSVMHNLPDTACRSILSNIVPAMRKGYSKLLIHDHVILDVGADFVATGLDFAMMTYFAGGERAESKWRRLLESEGLRILKIWVFEEGSEKLIEAELA